MSTFNSNPDYRPRKQQLLEKKWFIPAVCGALALIVGIGIGSGGQKTEYVDVPGAERVVTKEVEKEVTPQACLTALDLSEEGFGYSAEAMGYMSDALTAAGNIDVAGLQEANADLEKVSPKMKALTTPMKENAAKCRAAAK
jgi:hypothetical protein